ncbi:hypothetical protein LSUE1_G009568 [Lachnellula suecica]|uniref:Uncharacterized protein n=1 Tax=Lachnellula suecica TaxID=602035 RepID=A0A8T9C3K9_9HELO|nr:hypothetical protein LSUE1_G009568 [Lachnellula suecica]
MPKPFSSNLLYIAAGLNTALVLGHTKMGYEIVFPSTTKDAGGEAASIGWWEVNESFVFMGIFCLKWAKFGITDRYDKAILYASAASQIFFGYRYLKAGFGKPIIGLWGVPALIGLSQLV